MARIVRQVGITHREWIIDPAVRATGGKQRASGELLVGRDKHLSPVLAPEVKAVLSILIESAAEPWCAVFNAGSRSFADQGAGEHDATFVYQDFGLAVCSDVEAVYSTAGDVDGAFGSHDSCDYALPAIDERSFDYCRSAVEPDFKFLCRVFEELNLGVFAKSEICSRIEQDLDSSVRAGLDVIGVLEVVADDEHLPDASAAFKTDVSIYGVRGSGLIDRYEKFVAFVG